MKFNIQHHSGQTLAEGVNEETARRILRNIGPVACTVWNCNDETEPLNGVEWIIDNPGT